MKKINLFLLLKQGIKGVFKFKIQFFTMIILIFLSSLITTITLTNNKSLEKNYNQTMKKLDKFDYLVNEAVGTENMVLKRESTVPLMDAISNQFIENKTKSFYNFNLSSFDNDLINKADQAEANYNISKYNKTFITKVFEAGINENGEINASQNYLFNALISIFKQTVNDPLKWKEKGDFGNSFIGSLKSLFIFEKNNDIDNFIHANYIYPTSSLTIFGGLSLYKLGADTLTSSLMLTLGTEFKIQLFNDLNEYEKYKDNEDIKDIPYQLKYLKNTSIFKFWQNLDQQEKDNITINESNIKNKKSNNLNDLEVEIVEHEKDFKQPIFFENVPLYEKYKLIGKKSSSMFSTLVNTMVKNLIEQIVQNLASYSTTIFTKALEEIKEKNNEKELIEKIKNISGLKYEYWDPSASDEKAKYGNIWDFKKNDKGHLINEFKKNIKISLEYLTGRKYNVDSINDDNKHKENKTNYIVSKDNKAHVLNIDNADDEQLENNPTSQQDVVFKNGCRGNLVVPYYLKDKKTFYRIGSYEYLLNTVGGNSSIAQMFHTDFETIELLSSLNYNSVDFKIEPIYMTPTLTYFIRYKLLARLYNYDYLFRIERTLIENESEKIFRIINLDDDWMDKKLTIYSGYKPYKDSQVLINPQFLMANNLKIGDQIYIGPKAFDIVGTAADPLSYYPMVDLLNPIPNNKTNGIIYGIGKNIAKIYKNDYHKSIKQNIFSFFTAKDNVNKDENILKIHNHRYSTSFDLKNNYLSNVDPNHTEISFREKIVSFNDINYKINYTLQPKIRKITNIIMLITTVIIIIISCVAAYVAINKTIILNKEQIFILKALGLNTRKIAISYISYGIICLFFIVPIAYVIGTLTQVLFLRIFLQYFGGNPNQITWYWLPFVVCTLLFGIFIIIFSYIVAVNLISQQNKEKINLTKKDKNEKTKTNKWRNFKGKLSLFFSKKFGFKFILMLKISSKGFKKIVTLVFTVFIATLLITTSLTVPTVIANIKSSLSKSVNFKNKVDFYEPLSNAPLSGDSVSWDKDIEDYKKDMFDVKDENVKKISNFYRSVQSGGSFNNSSTIPPFIYIKSKTNQAYNLEWTIKYAWQSLELDSNKKIKDIEENDSHLVLMLISILSSNLFNFDGKSFSIMEFQNMIESIIHDDELSKEEKEKYLDKLLDLIELVTKGILKILFSKVEFEDSLIWKDILISFISQNTPPFVTSYILKDDNRKLRYQIGWNTTKYIHGRDNLATTLNVNTIKKNKRYDQDIIGVNKNQTAYILNKTNKKIFISDDKLQKLKKIYEGTLDESQLEDIYLDDTNSFKLYDQATATFNIPALFNEQASAKFKNSIENADYIRNKLLINQKYALPKSSWVYDDRDYIKILKDHDAKPFKSMFEIEQSRLTHAPIYQYEINKDSEISEKSNFANVSRFLGKENNQFDVSKNVSEISDKSYWFTEVTEDIKNNDGNNPKFNIKNRPYYLYDNILLILPKEFEKDVRNSAKEDKIKASDEQIWMGDLKKDSDFFKSEIFENIKNEWKNIDPKYEKSEYIFVRPYTLKFVANFVDKEKPEFPDTNFTGKEIFMLTDPNTTFWYRRNFENNGFLNVHPQEFSNIPNKKYVKHINFINDKSFDNLKTYGSATILADQDFINIICGYENTKTIPFNYQYNSDEKKGDYNLLGNNIETYSTLEPDYLLKNTEYFLEKALPQSQLKYRQNKWFNTVLSLDEEAKMLTTQTSFIRQHRLGDNTIQSDNIYTSNVQFKNVELRGSIDNLINQLTNLTTIIAINIIIIIIIIASLTLTIIIDLYINEYRKFISIMKSMGYSNWKISIYILSIATLLSAIVFVIASLISILLVFIMIKTASYFGFGLPFVISWWTPLLSFLILLSVYLFAIIMSTYVFRHTSPTKLIKRDD